MSLSELLRYLDQNDIKIWLDGAAEAYVLTEEIAAANVPVIIHPTMARPTRD